MRAQRATFLALALLVSPAVADTAPPAAANPALNPVRFEEPANHEPLALIRDGQVRFALAYDRAAEAGVREAWQSIEPAATAIQEAVRQVTGQEVPVVDINDAQALEQHRYLIVLGENRLTRKLGIDMRDLPPEGFAVATFGRGVAIVGHDGSQVADFYKPDDARIQAFRITGTLWGAYDFIERFLGVRYYFPGPGVIRPRIAELTIEPVRYTDHPRYTMRKFWNLYHEFGRDAEHWPWDQSAFPVDFSAFRDRWRLSAATRFVVNHTPVRWQTIHADRPELFYEDRYGRRHHDLNNYNGNVFDVSRRQTAEQYIRDVTRYYQSGWNEPWEGWVGPNSEYVPFGMPDNYVVVRNERTTDLLHPERGKFGEMSDVMARFHLWLAEELANKHPGKTLSFYAYAHHRLPPIGDWRFRDNMAVMFCHFNRFECWTDEDVRTFEAKMVQRWRTLLGGERIFTYGYMGDSELPVLTQIAGLQRYFEASGQDIRGVYYNSGGTWSDRHMIWYIAFRLAWNPAFDVDAALEEYYRLAYGDAAEPMRQAYKMLIDRWRHYDFQIDPPQTPRAEVDYQTVFTKVYPLDVVEKLQAWRQQALGAIDEDSVEHRRVAFATKQWPRLAELARAHATKHTPLYDAHRVQDAAVRIDGKLDDPAWQAASAFALTAARTGAEADSPSTLRMAWSPSALYLSLEMPEPNPRALKVSTTQRDGRVFKDDCVELILSPTQERQPFYQVVINAGGGVFDARFPAGPPSGEPGWDAQGLAHQVRVGEDRWVLEMKLPFTAMSVEAPTPYTVWYGNVVRNKLTEPAGHQTFSPVLSGINLDAAGFGMIRFAGEAY